MLSLKITHIFYSYLQSQSLIRKRINNNNKEEMIRMLIIYYQTHRRTIYQRARFPPQPHQYNPHQPRHQSKDNVASTQKKQRNPKTTTTTVTSQLTDLITTPKNNVSMNRKRPILATFRSIPINTRMTRITPCRPQTFLQAYRL